MARKGLPKKYARMGFKRGWAAYKRSKRKPATVKARTPRRPGVKMARRRYKKYYRYARGGGGKMKPIIDGLMVGAVSGFLAGKVPYSGAISNLAIGYFRNNTTLKTLGGVQLGQALLGGFFGGGNIGTGGVR